MVDTLSKADRSRLMAKIRGSDTGPERQARSLLHRMGYRFTLGNHDLPGSPDIVLPRHDAAIFVHGCFWHRHRNCRFAYMPKTRIEFWLQKFEANQIRDRRAADRLRRAGWRVWTIWECQLRYPARVASRLDRLLRS